MVRERETVRGGSMSLGKRAGIKCPVPVCVTVTWSDTLVCLRPEVYCFWSRVSVCNNGQWLCTDRAVKFARWQHHAVCAGEVCRASHYFRVSLISDADVPYAGITVHRNGPHGLGLGLMVTIRIKGYGLGLGVRAKG